MTTPRAQALNDEYVDEAARRLDAPPRSASAPRYEWVGDVSRLGLVQRCTDCGALVALADEGAHDRFHSILNDHAKAIATLLTSHLSPATHDRYDAYEKAVLKP